MGWGITAGGRKPSGGASKKNQTGAVPGAAKARAVSSPKAGSTSFLPLLPWAQGDINTTTAAHVHPQTEASLGLHFVCFHGSPLIDYILQHISNLHIRLPQHITMATPPGSGILDITGSLCFQQQARGVLQPRAAPLPASGALLLQLPHLHHEGLAPSASSLTVRINFFPLPPTLV